MVATSISLCTFLSLYFDQKLYIHADYADAVRLNIAIFILYVYISISATHIKQLNQ